MGGEYLICNKDYQKALETSGKSFKNRFTRRRSLVQVQQSPPSGTLHFSLTKRLEYNFFLYQNLRVILRLRMQETRRFKYVVEIPRDEAPGPICE